MLRTRNGLEHLPGGPAMADVCILLGSTSDLPIARKATDALDTCCVSWALHVASAHRTPKHVEAVVAEAEAAGTKVFIAIAGLAAALPGAVAALTLAPVVGVPIHGKVPYDSLLSIAQLPPGLPVATVGVDRGDNAGLLAAQIVGESDPAVKAAFLVFREQQTAKGIVADATLQQDIASGDW